MDASGAKRSRQERWEHDPRAQPHYDLYRRFRRILVECEAFDSPRALGEHVLRTLVDRSDEAHPVVGGRLYRTRGSELELVAVYGEADPETVGLRVDTSYPVIRELFDKGHVVARRRSGLIDPEIERRLGSGPFAAVVIDPAKEFVIGLSLRDAVDTRELEPAFATLHSISEACWSRRTLSADVAQAAEVQTSLLASVVREIEGYEMAQRMRPADLVGGDFYDVTELASGTYAVTVGDAVGHGLAAALQARDAVVGLRMGFQQQLKAVATLSRLDRVLARSSSHSRFVSLCYLELDPRGHFVYVNAGHPGPLIVDPQSGRWRRLSSTGPVLGLPAVAPRRYYREFDRLEPGEILIAFTDGVVEVVDSEDRELGIEAVVEVARECTTRPLEELVESLFALLDRYQGGGRQIDDQTIVALRRSR